MAIVGSKIGEKKLASSISKSAASGSAEGKDFIISSIEHGLD